MNITFNDLNCDKSCDVEIYYDDEKLFVTCNLSNEELLKIKERLEELL